MNKATGATVVFLLAFGGLLAYRSLRVGRIECEVCITFQGRTDCRSAAASTRETSIDGARTAACGLLAAGMTESIRCQNTPPDRVECRER